MQRILDAMDAPADVRNGRRDILAWAATLDRLDQPATAPAPDQP